jgi:hypothetical protein
VRFACEAVFLVLVAVGAALMDLRPLAIIILMACAWLLVALIERASSREGVRAAAEGDEHAPEPASGLPPEALPEVAPREAYRWLFWRRSRAGLEELQSPTAALEERPAKAHVRRIEPEREPEPEAVAVAAPPTTELEPEAPPGPAVTKRPLELPGLEEPPPPAPAPPPQRPRFLRPRQQAPEPAAPPPPPPAKEWNLWDLERKAREQAGDARRDEEWSALFTHLRSFATADGVLPKEFDGLVRESFGTLIEAA